MGGVAFWPHMPRLPLNQGWSSIQAMVSRPSSVSWKMGWKKALGVELGPRVVWTRTWSAFGEAGVGVLSGEAHEAESGPNGGGESGKVQRLWAFFRAGA